MSMRLVGKLKARLPLEREMFLSVFGGLESGVATTAAIVIGLTISEKSFTAITIAAYVTVIVQAFNAAAARYVGLRASEEIENQLEQERFQPFVNAVIQFTTHFLAAIIPMLPLYFAQTMAGVVWLSIVLAYLTLLAVSIAQGLFLRAQAKQNFIEIMVTGTLVIAVGSLAGLVLS